MCRSCNGVGRIFYGDETVAGQREIACPECYRGRSKPSGDCVDCGLVGGPAVRRPSAEKMDRLIALIRELWTTEETETSRASAERLIDKTGNDFTASEIREVLPVSPLLVGFGDR